MAHLQHKQARLMFVQLMVPVLFFIVVLIFFAWYLSPRIYLWWQMIASNTSSACGCELTPFFAFDSVFTSFLLVGLLLGIMLLTLFCWKLIRLLSQTRISARHYRSVFYPQSRSFHALVSSLHLSGRVNIINEEKPTAFCHGYIFPRIVISQGMLHLLTEDELRAVLAHEKYHLIHRNPLQLLLFHAITAVLFFIPGMKRVNSDFQTQLEIAADEMALNGGQNKKHLAHALYLLLDYQESHPVSFALSFYGHTIQERIEVLTGTHLEKRRTSLNFGFMFFFFLIVGVLTFMHFDRTALAQYDAGLCHPEYISQQCERKKT